MEPRVEKELGRLVSGTLVKIDKAISGLSKNPRPFGIKKLDENIHRIRVGDWRILFSIFDKEMRVVILRVMRRNEKTYRTFKRPARDCGVILIPLIFQIPAV